MRIPQSLFTIMIMGKIKLLVMGNDQLGYRILFLIFGKGVGKGDSCFQYTVL